MHTRRFQILISVQVALQLLIPAIAPWLHSFIECGGVQCFTSTQESESSAICPTQRLQPHCLSGCCHNHSTDTAHSSADESHQHPPDQPPPHDCAHCAICQAIAAPRILTSVVELSAAPELIVPLIVPACADPLLGFGLPPQCRAPPAA